MKVENQKLGHAFLVVLCIAFSFLSLGAQNRTEPASHIYGQSRANPESFQNLAARAQAAMAADHVPAAIQLYSHATRLRPEWAEGWWYLGTLLFDSRRFSEARDAFAHFIGVEHKQPGPGFGMLGLSEFQLKQYSKALAALERGSKIGLGTNPEFIRTVMYHEGILHNFLRQPEMALKRLTLVANQIAAAHPEAPKDAVFGDADLLNALGLAALRIFKLPSEIPAGQAQVVEQAGRCQALIALQDQVAAESELKQMLVLYPSQPGVHYMYGVFLLKEHPPLAVDEFLREIQVSPGSDAPRIQLALELLRTAEYRKGLKYAQEAISLAPNNFVAHVACGRLWLAIGKTDQALSELRIAVRLAPGSPDAHFALSRALTEAGLRTEAEHERAEFERLQKLAEAVDR
ncbi:MAG TPA: tetratricopeptide repeat protein [Terriglobales bacterium]|nr:tetratricopeptide repeat protein [Terriglobales bacterium]